MSLLDDRVECSRMRSREPFLSGLTKFPGVVQIPPDAFHQNRNARVDAGGIEPLCIANGLAIRRC